MEREVLLHQATSIQRKVLFVIDREFHIPPTHRESHDPIQFGRPDRDARVPVREHIDVAIQHDLIFVEIQVGVSDIPEQRETGIVGSRKVIVVMEEPSGPGVCRQVLIGKTVLPSRKILNCLEFCRHQSISIRLRHTLAVKGGVAFIL